MPLKDNYFCNLGFTGNFDIRSESKASRAVTRSENPGGHVILGGDNVPPLVEIGLTDLTKSGGHGPPGPLACDGPATVQQKGGVLKV